MISHLKGKVSRQTFRDELLRMAASINDRYGSATYLVGAPRLRRPPVPTASGRHLSSCSDPVKTCPNGIPLGETRQHTLMEDEITRWTVRRRAALVPEIIQAKTTVGEARRSYYLPTSEFELWVEDGKRGMENALRANSELASEQYER
jgi:hypothetical protein